ncbi:ABC transporter permease [Beggiatoa leptomitoformis]|uniref:Transport permease protein n=1 Tax=Beggiatoa leptomitoformis TaxID=288004 RepID=A0A2N9YGS3_9GAMM|nr:ABC transporter permease [Beggiatoa leptomitoformis]ALG68104.1 ABC transporter permease [Beggiatoa leptomitoformis]AUI69599.1 ABC transporter permease [Beggiatoa leptomitoformis]
MNWRGLYTLFAKEVWRFLKVTMQTILTPVVTNLLYLLVFSSVLESHVQVHGLSYTAFLVPGLMMMSLIQNAFSNSSSSLFQAKMNGNVVFMLLAPLSAWEIYLAFVGAAIVRGLFVGIGVWIAALWFVVLPVHNLATLLSFAILGSGVLGALGLIAALWAEKWDHVSAFQNFVILPLSFLSGVFYSVNDLPSLWQTISHYNPFFYMIDGFRYGFFGVADASVSISLIIVSLFFISVSGFCIWLLHIGYKLRS